MSYQSRRELLAQVFSRYREAYRKKKTIILNEFIASSGYSRKYAVRLLGKPMAERLTPIKRKRLRSYGAEVQEALQILRIFIFSQFTSDYIELLAFAHDPRCSGDHARKTIRLSIVCRHSQDRKIHSSYHYGYKTCRMNTCQGSAIP